MAAVLFCSDVLHDFSYRGHHDGVHINFNDISIYRSIVEFGEVPWWNPWYWGERAANEVLSLPMFPELSQAQLGNVCAAIRQSVLG
jgi:hypothetical protein